MFSTLKYRRHVAVLAAVMLLAGMLVAAPAVGDEHPEADYTADFSACEGVGSSDFEDIPANHAGSIDCIAYYGITQGTSATTYSPFASVTREHMALFLTRLAGRVGIEVTDTPDDPGFTDIGELSDKSQTAIAQLADLGITRGTSDTTYSPADSVSRGQMALFIARLMDQMSTFGGKDSSYAHTPSDVKDTAGMPVGSPFLDLGSATKSAYDAITNLWELGVASGISDTAYAPSALITRAAMADFMAGVMDHSNLRPAGLSIQASKTSGFDPVEATVVVSVRDDSYMPVIDQAVAVFNSESNNGGLDDEGMCDDAATFEGDCDWNDSDEPTNENGNIVDDGAGADEGMTNVYYAWIGDADTTEFDADDVDYVSVSITSSMNERSMKVTSDANERAEGFEETDGPKVHLGRTSSVTYTVQLVDAIDGGGDPVAKPGASIRVRVAKDLNDVNTTTHETDDDGQFSFTIEGPTDDDDDTEQTRNDTITITYVTDDATHPVVSAQREEIAKIRWIEAPSITFSAKAEVGAAYVIRESDDDAKVSASVTFYDQYGATFRQARGQLADIDFDGATKEIDHDNDAATAVVDVGMSSGQANVSSRGVARRSATLQGQTAGTPITVEIDPDPAEDLDDPDQADDVETGLTAPTSASSIQVVVEADADRTGSKNVHTAYTDDDLFLSESGTATNAEYLFRYDSDDIFVDGTVAGEGDTVIDMEAFEKMIAEPDDNTVNAAVVEIVIYSDGSSIFKVTMKSSTT